MATRYDVENVLGGAKTLGSGLDVLGKEKFLFDQANKPASPVQKWLAKVLAGEMSPREAAIRARLELQLQGDPSGTEQAMAAGGTDQPLPRLTEGLGGMNLFEGEGIDGTGIGASTGKRSASFGLSAPDAPPPPALMDGTADMVSEAMNAPPVQGAARQPLRVPQQGLGSDAFPGVTTQQEFNDVVAALGAYSKIIPRYRPTEDVERIDKTRGRIKEGHIDRKAAHDREKQERKIEADTEAQARREEAAAARQRERLTYDYQKHRERIALSLYLARQRMTELEKRLDMARQRIGADMRVAAAARLLDLAKSRESNIARIVTSLPSLADSPQAGQVQEDLQTRLNESQGVLDDLTEVLTDIAGVEKMLDEAEKEASGRVKKAAKTGQVINGNPVTPGTVQSSSSTTQRTQSGPSGGYTAEDILNIR